MSQSIAVIAALIAGLIAGVAIDASDSAMLRDAALTIRPIGELWLSLLQMTVIPLIVSLLITGIASATSTAATGGLTGRALLIFLVPPSLEDLFHRLRTRATETADELDVRQRNAAIELARQEDYDYVVVNETDQVDAVAARVDEIIAEEHERHPNRQISV